MRSIVSEAILAVATISLGMGAAMFTGTVAPSCQLPSARSSEMLVATCVAFNNTQSGQFTSEPPVEHPVPAPVIGPESDAPAVAKHYQSAFEPETTGSTRSR